MVGFNIADGQWLGFAEGLLVVGATARNNDFESVDRAAKFNNTVSKFSEENIAFKNEDQLPAICFNDRGG